jgi:hypothetical protein
MKKLSLAVFLCLSVLFFAFGEDLLLYIESRASEKGGLKFDGAVSKLDILEPARNISVIKEWAFAYGDLTAVNIPDGVTVIGKGAFASNALTSVVLPGTLQTIDEWAFAHNNITSIIFPENVALIGEYAFLGNNLTDITLGDFVHLTGNAVDRDFYACYNGEKRAAGRYIRKNDIWSKE